MIFELDKKHYNTFMIFIQLISSRPKKDVNISQTPKNEHSSKRAD